MKSLKITLKKSVIGTRHDHRENVKTLGLRKLNSSVVHKATPDILGKINRVSYLLHVEEVAK